MLNIFDIGVIGIILISGLIAFPRGLFQEVFSLLNWVLAGAAGFIGYTQFGDLAAQYIEQAWLAKAVAGVILAIVAYIIASIITSSISNALLNSSLGLIDRILGLCFGIARGIIIIVPAYWLLREFIPEEASPHPYLNAQATRPYLEIGREWINQNMPLFMSYLEQARGELGKIIGNDLVGGSANSN